MIQKDRQTCGEADGTAEICQFWNETCVYTHTHTHQITADGS